MNAVYFGPYIEVAETKWAGWGWHCSICAVTRLNFGDKTTATEDARAHFQSDSHRRATT